MEKHPQLLSNATEIAELAAQLKSHTMIAFDTEFIRENTFFPIVEIIQVATETHSWLIDVQAFRRTHTRPPTLSSSLSPGSENNLPSGASSFDKGLQPLLDIFTDPNILKIAHAAQGDQECLYSAFGIVASPSLDTAIAASLCGFGDAIGLSKLLKAELDVTLRKGHARTNWSVRPLPQQLMEYAHADVEYLILLATRLLSQLEKLGRKEWAYQLSSKFEQKSLYEADIAGLTEKLARGGRLDSKGYSALKELVAWREERVRKLNLPRRWVADDPILVDLAQARPKDLAHLGTFRGLNKGELKHSGEAILEAIRRASKNENVSIPRFTRAPVPSAEESQVLELLKCYVSILADRYQIAAKHLTTSAKLLPLLRSQYKTVEDLEKAQILSGHAARLIGEELIALVRGQRALSIQGSQVKIIKLEE